MTDGNKELIGRARLKPLSFSLSAPVSCESNSLVSHKPLRGLKWRTRSEEEKEPERELRLTNSIYRPLQCSKSFELNVGGITYVVSKGTLSRENSLLSNFPEISKVRDQQGRIFIDRNGDLFAFVLDYLRTGELSVPSGYTELSILLAEANFYKLTNLSWLLQNQIDARRFKGSFVTITEHSAYNTRTRDNIELVFRRTSLISVAGHVGTCRAIFGPSLSMDRDSNVESDRYSCRMLIMHTTTICCFERLQTNGFDLQATNQFTTALGKTSQQNGGDKSNRRNHVTNYLFMFRGSNKKKYVT
ncbi:BTB/POZ domain-containing protein KCTD8-like [Hydractinia symbiolongicarpus]|uniref:BTB/POZ domain-containing protein KCTD8-like n=1 Tax=Hydractinia symbiolongicarpus TaxID=13093 RepID=UPI00254C1C95|nr:BTB/POZ domain-containing protein KCTD8-like [Hydractinia symbiolongicarpus]XP_057301498.1 BTB/POZ domain-containing protein KCTD8-like [Hydractinia symbiolongicarpus]XP_057301499.1 BTB/POZ domain-containing protein KCTD8-like [Hydractinia symbiolongicarpus]